MYTSTKQRRLQSTERLAEEERKKGRMNRIDEVPGGCDDEEEVGDPRVAAGPPGRALPQERRPPHLWLRPSVARSLAGSGDLGTGSTRPTHAAAKDGRRKARKQNGRRGTARQRERWLLYTGRKEQLLQRRTTRRLGAYNEAGERAPPTAISISWSNLANLFSFCARGWRRREVGDCRVGPSGVWEAGPLVASAPPPSPPRDRWSAC